VTWFAAEVARMQEGRQARGCADLADEVLWIGDGAACYGASAEWICTAFGVGLSGAVTNDEMDHLVDFYEQRAVTARVELCPYAHPSFVSGLRRHGFVLDGFEQVFARALPDGEDLRAAHPFGWPPDVAIEAIDRDDDAQVDQLCEVVAQGFATGGKAVDTDTLAMWRRVARHPRTTSLLATVGGEPVGGATLEVDGEIAALYGTSVLPACRRKGIQLALVLARLEHARAQGARIACIESKPGIATERNAARAGFAVAYTKAMMSRPTTG